MATVHGKNSAFQLDDSGGTLRDLSANCNNVSFPQEVETADDTAFGDNDRSFLVGLKTSTISIDGHFSSTANEADAVLGGQLGGAASSTFQYHPEGNSAGKVVYHGECFVTSYEITGSVDDLVTFTAECQVTGAVTRSTT